MTDADRSAEKWRALIAEASLDLRDDLGDRTLTGDDLAYELVVTSQTVAANSAAEGGYLEEDFVVPCLWYLRRCFVIAQKTIDSKTESFDTVWTLLTLAYGLIELRQTMLALIKLDDALEAINNLAKREFEPYGRLTTVWFMITKYKERHGFERSEKAEAARTFELGAILSGACNACNEIGLDMRGLGGELTPLFQAYYDTTIPELSEVEALERALRPSTVN
jgi:hypothetical protein